jgi:TonB-linked SusC/RagA family outer membrane protein
MKTKFNGILTLLLALVVQISFAQQKTITGTVSDDSGALPGVSISIKGTSTGSETDFDGKYSIKTNVGNVLVFSYLGYKAVEKTVGSSNTLNVSLQIDANVLDEIVVTGVARGTSTKKLGFSLGKVSSESLQAVPAGDAANALRGKVAGVRIVASSGNPAAAASIRLRGSTSISGTQDPLIIVDGILTEGNLRDIPVEDIETIEVIKGAAAASLYGSLAGNGVIQIITKKGKGKLTVDLKSEYGFSEIQNAYPLTNNHAYLNDGQGVRMGDWDNDPTTPVSSNFGFDLSTGNRTLDPDGLFNNPYLGKTYDNLKNSYTSQPISTQTISLSGSDDRFRYFLSAQRFEQGGVLQPVDPFNRNSFRANFEVKASEKLTAKVSSSFITTTAPILNEQGQGSNVFYSSLIAEPFIDLNEKDANGQYLTAPSGYFVQGSNFQNPLYTQQEQTNRRKKQRLLMGINLDYKMSESWDAQFQQSIDQTDGDVYFFTPAGYVTPTPSPTLNDGFIRRTERQQTTTVTSLQTNYFKDFGDLDFSASAKYLYENRQLKTLFAEGYDFIAQGVFNVENTPLLNRDQGSYFQKEIARNYFLNVDLDYKDKLILNGLVRRDESSLFGADERIKYYGRAALAYRVSEDIKIKNIQELKFRAAFGTSGQRPPVFNAQYETFTVSSTAITPVTLGNKLLKPSVSSELEVGLNMDFLDRFSLEVNYSTTATIDSHIQVPLSGVAGFESQWQNIGGIQSDYIEVSLSGDIIKKDDFSWNFNLNFDTGNQIITDLNGVAPFTRSGLGAVDIFRVEEDLPYGTMYGSVLAKSVNDLSVDSNGDVLNGSGGGTTADYSVNQYGHVVLTSGIGSDAEDPLFLFDENTNSNAIKSIGNTNPDFNVGFATTFRYKGIGLYVLTDWQQGGDIYNYTKQLLYFNERHQDLQNFGNSGTHYNYAQQLYNKSDPASHFVEDGTFVKIREISLDYTLDATKTAAFLDSVRFSIAGRNMFTFTNYSGFDPEVAISTNPTNFRLDEFSYPNFRTVTMAVQIKF